MLGRTMNEREGRGVEELILLRHAHAEPEASSGRDLDRPLSTLGFTQAEAATRWLMERQLHPHKVLCSPSLRTKQTFGALQARLSLSETVEPGIYEATPGELIDIIERHRPAPSMLVVGHNPGLETLVGLLTDGRSVDGRGMPTAAIARLRIKSGAPLEPGAAEVIEFWWP